MHARYSSKRLVLCIAVLQGCREFRTQNSELYSIFLILHYPPVSVDLFPFLLKRILKRLRTSEFLKCWDLCLAVKKRRFFNFLTWIIQLTWGKSKPLAATSWNTKLTDWNRVRDAWIRKRETWMEQPLRFLPRLYKQRPAFDAKTSLVICSRTLFVPRSEQFSENCELWGTDNDV